MRVKCNWCDEVFNEKEIIDFNSYNNGSEFCPKCNMQGFLMDMEDSEGDEI